MLKNTAVVCAWFQWHIPLSLQTFVLSANLTSHFYLISEYAFTFSAGCFEILQTEDICGIMGLNVAQVELACTEYLTVIERSMEFLEKI